MSRIIARAGILCAAVVLLATIMKADETSIKAEESVRNAPKQVKSAMPDEAINPRIELSDPVTVSLAPPQVQWWGPWQFPGLSRLRDGRILISWHVEADSEKAYGLPPAYAVSADEGKTWTTLPREGEALRRVLSLRGGTRLPNGDSLLGAGRPRSRKVAELKLPEKPFGQFIGYGRTRSLYLLSDLPPECAAGWKLLRLPAGQSEWREEQAIVRLPGETRSVSRGVMAFPGFGWCDRMIVAPDGALLAEGFYGRRVVNGKLQQKTVAFMLRSTDQGKTWDLWSEIPYAPDSAADPHAAKRAGFTEPMSIFMPDGSLLCLMRTTDGNGPGPLYRSRSTDGGKTWSHPAVFDDLGVLPQLLALKNGVTLAAYGRPGLYVRATADPAGLRWEKRITVVEPGQISRDTCSYTALLPLSDNSALLAYSDFKLPNADGKLCKGIQVRKVTVNAGRQPVRSIGVKTPADSEAGKVVFPEGSNTLAQAPVPMSSAVVAPHSVSEGTMQELAALVEKTSLPTGTRLVCLGDSITAVTKHQPMKYPEMIGLALKMKLGDKVKVFNAGKSGNKVPSALKRLEADVIARKPTLVFINLGVNDSKLTAPDHTRNQVPFDQFTASYRALLKAIREKTGADPVIVGAVACVDEWAKAVVTRDKNRNYLGNPEQLKKYNAAAQAIAGEFGCDYIDLFDYFMAQPDLKALFPEDGVHVNQQGQELIALQLMRYLARKYPAQPSPAGKIVADKVDDYIRAEMAKQHIPGLALAVVREGRIEKSAGYGLANIESNVPVRPDTVFQIQSITKTFTATAIMMLVEQGRIALDDKITKYLSGLPPSWRDITVRQLLAHTSGIKDYIKIVNLQKDITPEDVIKLLEKRPLDFTPGEKYGYSNTGYILLGMIIRKVTGKNWDDFVRERILDPLGMQDTRVISPSDRGADFAAGYCWDGKQNRWRNGQFVAPTILAYAGGGLCSTALDLAKWDAALYTEKLLKRATLDEMWTPVKLNNGSDGPKGLSWTVGDYQGHRLVNHTGSHVTGFMSAMGRFVDDKLTVIVLINTNSAKKNAMDIAKSVASFYIAGLNNAKTD